MIGLQMARSMVERLVGGKDVALDPDMEEETDRFMMDGPEIDPH